MNILNMDIYQIRIQFTKNCFKLPPGSYLKIKLNKFKFNQLQNFNNINNIENLEFVKWWNVDDNIKKISTSFPQTKII